MHEHLIPPTSGNFPVPVCAELLQTITKTKRFSIPFTSAATKFLAKLYTVPLLQPAFATSPHTSFPLSVITTSAYTLALPLNSPALYFSLSAASCALF